MNNKLRDTMRTNLRREAQSGRPGFGSQSKQSNTYSHSASYSGPAARPTIEKAQQYKVLSKERMDAAKEAGERAYNARSSYDSYMDKYYDDARKRGSAREE